MYKVQGVRSAVDDGGASITGNPQNMLIGNVSQIGYRDFALALSPVAVAGLAITILLLLALYRTEFQGPCADRG